MFIIIVSRSSEKFDNIDYDIQTRGLSNLTLRSPRYCCRNELIWPKYALKCISVRAYRSQYFVFFSECILQLRIVFQANGAISCAHCRSISGIVLVKWWMKPTVRSLTAIDDNKDSVTDKRGQGKEAGRKSQLVESWKTRMYDLSHSHEESKPLCRPPSAT